MTSGASDPSISTGGASAFFMGFFASAFGIGASFCFADFCCGSNWNSPRGWIAGAAHLAGAAAEGPTCDFTAAALPFFARGWIVGVCCAVTSAASRVVRNDFRDGGFGDRRSGVSNGRGFGRRRGVNNAEPETRHRR